MNKKSIVLALILALSTVFLLTGCFEKEDPDKTKTPEASGDSKVIFQNTNETFGNGTDIVVYKGEIYYIEYGNTDFTEDAVRDPWYYVKENSNNQRYVNKIDAKGNIKNLFSITGANKFAIVDDRFYLQSTNGRLYTVDLNNQNEIQLSNKGQYLAFDDKGDSVYYLNTSSSDYIFKIDTQTLSLSNYAFDNPLKTSGYTFLGLHNGDLYYAYIDKSSSELLLMKHKIIENVQEECSRLKITLNEKKYNNPLISDFVVCVQQIGRYAGICIGTPSDGNMGGFNDKAFYTFDLEDKGINKIADNTKLAEGELYYEDELSKMLTKELYKLDAINIEVPDVSKLFTEGDRLLFANKYMIDLEDKLGDEAKDSMTTDPDESKYLIELEDYTIVGNNVFYKITASRRNPLAEVGWRAAYVRMCTEVYAKNLITGAKEFIYSYINNNYELVERKIAEALSGDAMASGDVSGDVSGDFSGDIYGYVSGEIVESNPNMPGEDELKDDEMYIEIDTTNIWKSEFDVKVEEVGGMIIGKRIEYEGHHTKDESIIKVKVKREPGAMLTVYIDGEASSNMVFEQ